MSWIHVPSPENSSRSVSAGSIGTRAAKPGHRLRVEGRAPVREAAENNAPDHRRPGQRLDDGRNRDPRRAIGGRNKNNRGERGGRKRKQSARRGREQSGRGAGD